MSTQVKLQGLEEATEFKISPFGQRAVLEIYPDRLDIESLFKEVAAPAKLKSRAESTALFHVPHPVDYRGLFDLRSDSVHHENCVDTKVNATMGLGFRSDKVSTTLDPLTLYGSDQLLRAVGWDYYAGGQAYIEVVRRGNKIAGLHHMANHEVYKVLEDPYGVNFHWEIMPVDYEWGFGDSASKKIYARFGDKERLLSKAGELGLEDVSADEIGELIHLPRCIDSSNRHYSIPDWLAAVPYIGLIRCLLQHQYDFFNNRGVPEMAVVVKGAITKKHFQTIANKMKATIGIGNQFKSFVVQVPQNGDIAFEKLAFETQAEGFFKELMETLSLHVVTAHKTPPLLGGIQTPGKLGATNEFPNALQSFQTTCIMQEQVNLSVLLACTLGKDPGIALSAEDFAPSKGEPEEMPEPSPGFKMPIKDPGKAKPGSKRNGFNTVLDMIDIKGADTISRMREPLPEAQASGRDLGAGVKK